MTRKLKFVVLLLIVSFFAWAQAPSASTPAIEARADAMLKQLSLEEKIDLIGGLDDFYIREIKHIGLPALKMADGPFGVRNYGPSTTFGGLGLAATWDSELAERWVGSCRRHLLDHVVPLNERHLRRLLSEYVRYYHQDRTHLGLMKDTSAGRNTMKAEVGLKIVSYPRLGGLHHRYEPAA